MTVPVRVRRRSDRRLPDWDGTPAVGVRVLYLEVDNTCNSRCTTCPLTFGIHEAPARLEVAEVTALAAQVPDLERCVLHGVGEPLLHPDLAAMVRVLSDRDVHTCFNTNGLLLDAARMAELIDAGLDDLRVSLDAAQPDTYKAIRGVNGHRLVVRNLRRAAEMRDATGGPRITVYFTAMRSNLEELPDVLRVCSDAGVDALVVQRLTWFGDGLATDDQSLFCRLDARQRELLRQVEADAPRLGVELVGTAGLGPLDALQHAPDRQGCARPWTTMYVTAQLNVYSCCIAPFTGVPLDRLVLGDLEAQTVAEIWSGGAYQDVRASLHTDDPAPFCAGCGERWSY